MLGGLTIVSVATTLVTTPTWLLACNVYGPASAGCALEMLSVSVVAPLIRPALVSGVPLSRQRKVSGALPAALAVKEAMVPARLFVASGWRVSAGCARQVRK